MNEMIINIIERKQIFDYDYQNMVIDNINKKKKELFCVCGNKMYYDIRATLCVKCASLRTRKVERPPIKQLLLEIEELGYRGTGRKYGVSDNAIRRWVNKKRTN